MATKKYLSYDGLAEYDALIKAYAETAVSNKQDKLAGAEGQVIGFDADGNAVATEIESANRFFIMIDPSWFTMTNTPIWSMSSSQFESTGYTYLMSFDDETSEKTFNKYISEIHFDFSNGVYEFIFKESPDEHIAINVICIPLNDSYASTFQLISGSSTADMIAYDNASSGLTATNVQEAIDKVASSSSALVVTFSIIGSTTDAWTGIIYFESFSHTYDEIVSAYNEGKQVLASLNGMYGYSYGYGIFHLTGIEEDEIHFVGGGFYQSKDKPILYLSIYKDAKSGYMGKLSAVDNIVTEIDFTNSMSTKQDVITGTAGDFVVIGADGNVTTKTIPNAEEVSF